MGRRLLRDYNRKKLRSLARKQFTSKQHRWIRRQDRYMKSGRLLLNAAARKIQHRFRYRSLAKPRSLPFRTQTLVNRSRTPPPVFRLRGSTPTPRKPAPKRSRAYENTAAAMALGAARVYAAGSRRNRFERQVDLQNRVYTDQFGNWRSDV